MEELGQYATLEFKISKVEWQAIRQGADHKYRKGQVCLIIILYLVPDS